MSDTSVPIATEIDAPTDPCRGQRADARRNRERVLLAARKLFAAHGLDAQMDRIARDAGVGVGTVYRHFPNKEDLLEALIEDRFERLAARGREALEVDDPWQGFCEFMTFAARVMAEDRALSEAMSQWSKRMQEAADASGVNEIAGRLIARAQESGDLRAEIEVSDVPMVICGLGRSAHVEITGMPFSWRRFLVLILDGMRAPGGSPLPPLPTG
ncbi:MAG: TetR family transcriptional regulator [Solirubrobacterales bacterium]|nr:TetR family transcriptional regulator [Solirubrobacterales bacterium]